MKLAAGHAVFCRRRHPKGLENEARKEITGLPHEVGRAPGSELLMCGRYVLAAPKAELVSRFELSECADLSPRYNITPGTDIPVVQICPEGQRVLRLLRWGLVSSGSNRHPGVGSRLSNARGETVAVKSSFRAAFKHRRCLVPASGFFEWEQDGADKRPHYISVK